MDAGKVIEMGILLRRIDIRERLRLGLRQSYRIIPPSRCELINTDEVVDILNAARRGIREPFTILPSDLMTAEEISAVILDGLIPAKRVLAWTRRTKNVPPHFRFNKQTTRFPRRLFEEWIRERAHIRWPE